MKKMKKDLGRLQAVLVPKGKAVDMEEALHRARKYGEMHIVDSLKNYWRCRRSGSDYPDYHTKSLPNGIKLIYGRELDGSEED